MSVETPLSPFASDEYEERGFIVAGTRDLAYSHSETPVVSRLVDRFQLVMVPFAAAVAITAPALAEPRRIVFKARASQTSRIVSEWQVGSWAYTTEPASFAEVDALNQLLALPAHEGLILTWPED